MNAHRHIQRLNPYSGILVLAAILLFFAASLFAGVTKVEQSSNKMTTTGTAAGDKDYSKESLFTGNAAFQVPLVQMGAVDLTLQYNSNIRRQVRTDNRLAPSGWIGVGWNLTLGSIVGEVGGTADTSDDRYRYVDANGSTDIIRLSSGEYVLQQYRPWKITRSIVSGLVAGWTIVKEDGTIMRFGNYRQASGTFSVSLDSTYATRCAMGFSGIVENPPASLYSSATLVPYQWDLTEVLTIGGARTSITYQQVMAPLSVSGSTSTLSYTRESHPWKINNNQGGEVECVLGSLNSDEYDAPAQTYMQNVYESKHLDTLAVRQNGQIVKRIVLKSVTSQDVLSIGAKKRYLNSLYVHDRNGVRMLVSRYSYCGLAGEAAGVNPGAVRRISYRSGGCTEYTYKSQPLTRDTLSVIRTIPSNIPGTPGNAAPSPTGVDGTDFYVVSQSLYRFYLYGGAVDTLRPMEVYRRGVTGWYRDTSFPYDSTTFCQVGNDVVVGFFKARWKAVRRSGEGWAVYDIDSVLSSSYDSSPAKTRGPVGFGPTYFVFKFNRNVVSQGDHSYAIAAVHPTEMGLRVQTLGSGFHETNYTATDGSVYVAPFRADCGENFFALTSRASGSITTAPMMASYFKLRSGSWSMLAQRPLGTANPFPSPSAFNFATLLPSHRIGKNFVASTIPLQSYGDSIYVFQHSAGYLKPIDSSSSLAGSGTQVSVGDFYYAVGALTIGTAPWIKTWTGQTWDQTNLSAQFPSDNTSLTSTSIFQSGRKLVFTGKTGSSADAQVFAIIHNGSSWTASGHYVLNDVLDFPRASAFGENGFLLEDRAGQDLLECHLRSISFDGDTLRSASVVPKLNCNSTFASSWYWQPGRNFVTSFRLWNNSGGWVDTNQVLTQCLDSLGRPSFARTGYDIVIDRKTSVSGMGDSIVTTFAFENGIFDDQVSGGKYNKVTVTHPGATGKTVTYFYNDLGATYSEEFFAGKNVPVLDGTSYRVKEYNNSSSLVRETVQFWSADPVDSVRGVYFTALLRDSMVTDGIPRLTTYEYGNPAHRQVTRVSETNSDGTQRVTRMKYPLDYAVTSGSSTSAIVRMLDSMKNVTHMVSPVIERWVFSKTASDSSSVLSGELTTYARFGAGQVLPAQSLRLRDSSVTNFTASSSQSNAFTYDARYVPTATYDLYTLQGNPVQVRDGNGTASSTIWGYSSALPVASAVNARTSQNSVGGECSYIGFESGSTTPTLSSDEDYWSFYSYNGYNVMSTDAHSGLYSQKLPGYFQAPVLSLPDTMRFGPTRDFCPPDLAGQNRKYVITCWVKTESGMGAGAARLIAHSKPNSDNNTIYPLVAGAYQSRSTGDTYGGWICLEDTINLKAIRQLGGIPDNELLRIRVFPINYDASHYMLVDDIRVHPVDATVRATAYDPVLFLPTYESDASGLFTARTYDGFGRPLQVKNAAGSVLQENTYYFSRDGAMDSIFHANDPNYVKQKVYRTATDTTTVKTYTDGLGREIQKQIFLGTDDIIYHTKYDSLSRPRYSYKAYQVSLGAGKHLYDANVASNLTSYYTGLGVSLGSAPYAESRYVQDPLNRVELQGSPGTTFAIGGGHDIRMDYSGDQTNTWNVARRRDEQGDTTRVSTDLFGNAVRSEVLMGSSASLVTASTFDVLGNLIKSTPPLGNTYSTTYKYTTRGELRQKTSPDAGTVRVLYDKKGNLRFTRDGAHTGSGANSVNISSSVNPGATVSGNFTLNNRGKVTLSLNAPGLPIMGGNVTMRVQTTGGTVLSTLVTTGPPQYGSLILPQGTYTWSVQSTVGMPPPIPYAIQCLTQYPFTYNKYDGLGRIIESGEYVSSDTLAFTQTNADSAISPPLANVVLSTTAGYDTASWDAMASGQHNLKGKLSWSCAYRLGTLALTTFYSYDDMGRIEWTVEKGLGSASKKIALAYDLAGNLTTKTYTDAFNTQNNFMWWYDYDAAGRLARVYSGVDFGSRVKEAEYSYLAHGRASQLALGAAPAQTLAYTYNERDWMRSITSSQFWAKLGYNTLEEIGSALSTPAQYAGNISWMAYSEAGNTFSWGPPTTTTIVGYAFGYDKASRLTSARFGYQYNSSWAGYNSYNMPMIGYDKNGNIDTLVRYGTNATLMDNLKYRYTSGTNRLDYITDAVSSGAFTTDIDNLASGAYRYDGNGSVQADSSRNLALIVNDLNNLPVVEYRRDGTVIQYAYDASGNRVQKTVGSAYTWYVGGPDGRSEIVYSNSTSDPMYNIWSSDNIGQVKRSGATLTRFYYLKDHLGDVRMTVTAAGAVDAYVDYYPYGQFMDLRASQGSSSTRYQYTSKERDTETGLDYFGARYYDGRIGRWLSVDPLTDAFPFVSGYCYSYSSPIRIADPDGLAPQEQEGQDERRAQHTASVTAAVSLPFPYSIIANLGAALGYANKGDFEGVQAHNNAIGFVAVFNALEATSAAQGARSGSGTQSQERNKPGAAKAASEATEMGTAKAGSAKSVRTNPYKGAVDRPVTVVDEHGNAMRVEEGGKITGSDDGQWQQVRDSKGNVTGTRIDGPHGEDQTRHGHVKDVTTPSGNPHLPLKQKENKE